MTPAATKFCSIYADSGGREPLYGTAIRADRCVFISWPRQWWHAQTFRSRGFPEDLATLIKTIRGEGRAKFFLFNPDDISSFEADVVTVACMPCGKLHQVALADLPGALSVYETSCLCAVRPAAEAIGPSVFVCTHSVRDQCCAKFGFGFARALRSVAPSIRVFETSHLGGDRFAGTAITFPSGAMHGWLRPGDATPFAEALLAGRILARTYRGSVFLDRIEQVVEAYIHSTLHEEFDIARIELVRTRAPSQNARYVDVRVTTATREFAFELTLEQRVFAIYSDCVHLAEGKFGESRRWIVKEWSQH